MLAKKIVPDSKDKEALVFLDKRLIATPPLAVSQCRERTKEMAISSKEALQEAIASIFHYDDKAAINIEEKEHLIDDMEDKLSTFLLELSSVSLTDEDSKTVTELLHSISDFERISDHAINMIEIGQEINQNEKDFSDKTKEDFVTLFAALTEISEITVKSFIERDVEIATNVEPLEEVIDRMTLSIRNRHIARLRKGVCNPELGVYLSDLLINCERVSDHCSNIAISIIQLAKSNLNVHNYISELKAERTQQFIESFNKYDQKYRLAVEYL